MALINCPECQNQISDKADNCPKCGYPIAGKKSKITVQKKEGCFLQTLNLGCLIFVIAILLFISSFIYNRLKKIDQNHLKNDTKNIIHNHPKRGSR